MPVKIKICGIKTKEGLAAAAKGAAFIGFNFYRASPRYVYPEQAEQLSHLVPPSTKIVAVLVDADDASIETIFERFTPDYLQLHGKETPERAAGLKERFRCPIIRAFSIGEARDFDAAAPFEGIASHFLFDARPPPGALLPGGNAVNFDWKLLQGRSFARPWFLAGGLNARNLKEAVELSGAQLVDISSGVERAPGEKNPKMIEEVLRVLQ